MKQFSKRTITELAIILILGLTPLLWFKGNEVILGHDAGLTLTPVTHFTDRLYAWTLRYSFGDDQSYALAGFFIHGLEALVAMFVKNVQTVQKIIFVFWFLLPGLTMFYFMKKLEKSTGIGYLALPASVFYMFNHYLLQGWFIAERTEFSLYAALPLLLAFLFDWKEGRRSSLPTALLISLTFFFLNGEADVPLYGGVIISIIVFFLFYIIEFPKLKSIFQIAKLAIMTAISSILLAAYWMLPLIDYLSHSLQKEVTQAGGLNGVLGWLNYESQDSSLINLLRLQGIPEWYQNPLHPYASTFLKNPALVGISIILPLFAFLPLLLYRERQMKKTLVFFAFLALFSMVFVAGSHAPFGSLYLLLIKFVPGFLIFRSPYYKFAPALFFSYAILLSFSCSFFLTRMEKRNPIMQNLFYGIIILAIILYSYPFLTGDFFNYIKGVRSMKTQVPQYVFDFAKWSESKERAQKRTLMLPPSDFDFNVDAYTWGYWSLAPLSSLYSNSSIINNSPYLTNTESQLLQNLYNKIREGDPSWINLAKMMHIDSLVLRNDFDWQVAGSPTDKPAEYRKTLSSSLVKNVKNFKKWEVYDINEPEKSSATFSKDIQLFDGESSDIGLLSTVPDFSPETPIASVNYIGNAQTDIESFVKTYYIKPQCVMCNNQWKYINNDAYIPLLTRDSLFYRFFQKKPQSDKIPDGTMEKVKALAYESYPVLLEFSKLVNDKKDQNIVISSGNSYNESLDKLNDSLHTYFANRQESLDEDSFIEILSVLRAQRRDLVNILPNISGTISGYSVYSLIQNGLQKIQMLQDAIQDKDNLTLNENTKNLVFLSKKSGNFIMYYNPNEKRKNISNISFELNNKKISKPLIEDSNKWYQIDNIQVQKEKNHLKIEQPVQNIYENIPEIILYSKYNGGCYISKPLTGQKGDLYHIAFSHQRLGGSEDFYVKFTSQRNVHEYLDANIKLSSVSTPNIYSQDFMFDNNELHYFIICNRPSSNQDNYIPSSIRLENINVFKIAVPDVFFAWKDNFEPQKDVSLEKINQTQYSVAIPNQHVKEILTFDQSFSPKWTISYPNAEHFIVDGYANGWVINSGGKGTITYSPQELVDRGFIISGIALMVNLLTLIYLSIRNKIWKK